MLRDSICVHGGVQLQGKVKIQGSKNAALPILAATLLTEGENILYNCPRISDVSCMKQLLQSMGCIIKQHADFVSVDATNVCFQNMPTQAVQEMRSSVCMLSVLLARCGKVFMEYPGGCVIGERPIDMHIHALEKMGACFEEKDGKICGWVEGRLHGAEIHFEKVSVGATENTVLAAVLAEGSTTITGAAKEPEVAALCSYLCGCGANIRGIGSDRLRICGVKRLHGTKTRIPADRIVAGTYLMACVVAGGSVFLEDAPVDQMEAVLDLAKEMGVVYQENRKGLYVQAPKDILMPAKLQTQVYPGFPTDLQSLVLVAASKAEGSLVVEETIFEARFHVVEPLKAMGADLQILDNRNVRVKGPVLLHGQEVEARELRGGAALVIAGLGAQGITKVNKSRFIMRGYENICMDLRELGARVISV